MKINTFAQAIVLAITVTSTSTYAFDFGSVFSGSDSVADFDSYQKADIEPAEILPKRSDVMNSRSRVVVYNFEDSVHRGTGNSIAQLFIKDLQNMGGITIVDSSLDKLLANTIRSVATKMQSGEYKGRDIVDYAIIGKLTRASAGKSYTPPGTTTDQNGRQVATLPSCTVSGTVGLSVKIIKVPSLEVYKTYDDEASSSGSFNAVGYGCPPMTVGEENQVIYEASDNVVRKIHTELKNSMSPLGYVLEKRVKGSNAIFQTSIGVLGGAKPGMKVAIFKYEKNVNALTNLSTTDLIKVTDATVLDRITDSNSYIKVSDSSKVDRIKMGYVVKLKFEDSITDSMIKIFK